MHYLDFEKTIQETDQRIEDLKIKASLDGGDIAADLERLNRKLGHYIRLAYHRLTPWQKAAVARHEARPHTSDYIKGLFTDFLPLRGDRAYAEDKAIIGGFARFDGQTVMVIGHEKGHDTETRLTHNFGMAKPEGYRKAVRLMKLAEQYRAPVITLVDTSGAFPGMEGEERGQGYAIAACTDACLNLRVPAVSVIIGEGGSGGAIALAAANRILMLEHSIYSVISPEGCASILWKDGKFAPKASEALCFTAQDLLKFNIIDDIIPEPAGGAHRFPDEAMAAVRAALQKHLTGWDKLTPDALVHQRHEKFLEMTRLDVKE